MKVRIPPTPDYTKPGTYYVVHPDDFAFVSRMRRAIGAKPLDGADPEAERGVLTIVVVRCQ